MSDSRDPMDCSAPASSVRRIFQTRLLDRVAISFYFFLRGSSQPRDRTPVSGTAGRFFTHWAAREAPLVIRTTKIESEWNTTTLIWEWLFFFFFLMTIPSVGKNIENWNSHIWLAGVSKILWKEVELFFKSLDRSDMWSAILFLSIRPW